MELGRHRAPCEGYSRVDVEDSDKSSEAESLSLEKSSAVLKQGNIKRAKHADVIRLWAMPFCFSAHSILRSQ